MGAQISTKCCTSLCAPLRSIVRSLAHYVLSFRHHVWSDECWICLFLRMDFQLILQQKEHNTYMYLCSKQYLGVLTAQGLVSKPIWIQSKSFSMRRTFGTRWYDMKWTMISEGLKKESLQNRQRIGQRVLGAELSPPSIWLGFDPIFAPFKIWV